MQISELKANQGFDVITATVTELKDARTFQKFGKEGRVRNGTIKDDSGSCDLTLWNEQCDQVNVGDTVVVKDGFVREWQGNKQVSTGRNGSMEVSSGGAAPAEDAPAEDAPADEAPEETI